MAHPDQDNGQESKEKYSAKLQTAAYPTERQGYYGEQNDLCREIAND